MIGNDTNRRRGLHIYVRPTNSKEEGKIEVDKALHILKKLIEKEGIMQDLQEKRYYSKPSEKTRERMRKSEIERKRQEKKRNRRNFA
jgi:small subunit ribosomal protein S21